MAESSGGDTPKPGTEFGYKRRLIEPTLQEAKQDLIDSGLEPKGRTFIATKQRVARKYLEKEAQGQIDSLTGLLNRTGLMDRLIQEATAGTRDNQERVLFFMDANGLKHINDTQGHEAGDTLLRDIAERIKKVARTTDIFARLGGDEFAAIIPANESGARELFKRLNEEFMDREKGVISIATGMSVLDPYNPELSLKKADEAMYVAKDLSKKLGENILISSADLAPAQPKVDTV